MSLFRLLVKCIVESIFMADLSGISIRKKRCSRNTGFTVHIVRK